LSATLIMSLSKSIFVFIFLGLAFQFFVACSPPDPDLKQLEGTWDIQEAQRNGRSTQTLENVYFKFDQDSLLTTNIFGDDNNFNIRYDYPKIEAIGSQFDDLSVVLLDKDTLVLHAQIRDFRYNLSLLRTNP
jgi:hypothetical protein